MQGAVQLSLSPTGPGARVAGRYVLEQTLQWYGLGECWLAHAPELGTRVVVKLLGPCLGAEPAAFASLSANLRGLTVPYVVPVIDGGVHEGRLFLVTEFHDGRMLARWLSGHKESRSKPFGSVVQPIFEAICTAVEAAHARSIVHGAISGHAVILQRQAAGRYHPRAIDFSVVPFLSALDQAVGDGPDRGWRAPELSRPGATESVRSDVFSLALLLVEMLTLSAKPLPDKKDPWNDFIQKHGPVKVRARLGELRDDIPSRLWDAVALALHPDPAKRVPTVADFARQVRSAIDSVGGWRDAPEAEQSPPEPTGLITLPPAAMAESIRALRAMMPEEWGDETSDERDDDRDENDSPAVMSSVREPTDRVVTRTLEDSTAVVPLPSLLDEVSDDATAVSQSFIEKVESTTEVPALDDDVIEEDESERVSIVQVQPPPGEDVNATLPLTARRPEGVIPPQPVSRVLPVTRARSATVAGPPMPQAPVAAIGPPPAAPVPATQSVAPQMHSPRVSLPPQGPASVPPQFAEPPPMNAPFDARPTDSTRQWLLFAIVIAVVGVSVGVLVFLLASRR